MKNKINKHSPTLLALLVVLLLGLMAFRLSAQSVPKTQPDSVKTETPKGETFDNVLNENK